MFKRRNRAQGTAVVTACWQWPIYSHTFVYQEMIGLTHMGLDVRLFHWELGETAQLHKAFGYLADHRTQLQPVWENHLRDKAHFDKTKPGRLRSFLERVSAATGKSVEDLEKEPMVLQGCTFARMAELAGADYLHSYFFYDQSFMCMQAAWLLELPRGVSCYADHMLQDFPFKLVPLQVELSDVIVATSARIKRELSQMTGGRFDDKILVKPNGVDGARFPPVVRQDRKPTDPFEVVSISRIEPKKGLTHLVEAVAMLKQRGRKVKAHIVGSKDPHSKGSLEYAAEFEALIEKLGVKDEVILHGMKKQEELPPILQRCRAFVAPYVEMGSGDKDGIPTAMLEGLASGLPVVTTDSGSILEVVTTEVEGIVVPQRDSKAFAAALERLIADPALERRMAKAARDRFDREFDIRVTEVRLHERVAGLVKKRQRTHGKGKSQQPTN
jgi:glycosyltransferase involved in cell wall biosynthesis